MKTSGIKSKTALTKAEKELFFNALENNPGFLQEALEVALNLVISDPMLTAKTAELIESDFKNLYQALKDKIVAQQAAPKTSACCKDLLQ